MAIKLKAQSDLGNILSISVSASATDSPAQLSVRYLTNDNSIPNIGSNVRSFVFGSLVFNGILVSQSSHREQGSNYLVREWMDNSVELDQNCIVLYRAGLTAPATNITQRTYSIPTIGVTRNADGNYNYQYSNTSWTSLNSRLASAGGQILGAESYSVNSCTRSEVTYDPNTALNIISAPAVNSGGVRVSYEGTYRSVLSSIYGDFGCTFWWNWANDTIQKIDSSSGPVGSVSDWGFSDTQQLDQNCRIFSYEIGATRVGVATRSNWHVFRNTWDYPEEDRSSSSNANFRQFINGYNNNRNQSPQGPPETITYQLPPYSFTEKTTTIKAYSSFTVNPVTGPTWPSLTTIAYSHIEGLRLYDALMSGALSIAGYGVIGGYQMPPAALFENESTSLWLIEQGFDRGLPLLPQVYAYLGIDPNYTILLAFELDGAANGSGTYELWYPYTEVSYSTGTSDKWFFRSQSVQYTPSATARGFDPCESGYGSGGKFGLWRQPGDNVEGDTESSYFGDATSGCLIQIQQVDMIVDLWRVGIEFGSDQFDPGGSASNYGGRPGGAASNTGGVTSFYRSLSISNPEQLAYWLENGLVILAVRSPNYSIGISIGSAVNCGDLSDLAGYENPNSLAVQTPNNVPAQIPFEPNVGTFTVPNSWAGGPNNNNNNTYNPGYGRPSSYNNNNTTIGAGSTGGDPCSDSDDGGGGGEAPPEDIPEDNPPTEPDQEVNERTIAETRTEGTKQEPGLTSATGTSIIIGPVKIITPSLASYRITAETDIEELSREEDGTRYEFAYEEPEEISIEEEPIGESPGSTPSNSYNRATESNNWFFAGGLSNNAGLQHSVVITDITDFGDYDDTPSALISPSSWLQTASAETDGFYFPVQAGLTSLSAQFASDGTLSVQYGYRQIAQKTMLERVAKTSKSSTDINIFS